MHRSHHYLFVVTIALSLAFAGAACGKDKKKRRPKSKTETPAAETTPAEKTPAADPGAPATGGSGVIQGSVKFDGDAPEMRKLDRSADPVCAKTESFAEVVVVNENQTLRNVVVRIKPGTVKGPAPTDPIEIKQSDCVFHPRVQGAVTNQEITMTNGDPTTHNLHAFNVGAEGEESLFNLAQPKDAPPVTKDANGFDVIKLKCDVHPWMVSWVVVTDHPYFAVTGKDGSFKIEGVPAGKYTLEAWHEHYGVKTAEIEVADKGTADAAFTFAAADKPL